MYAYIRDGKLEAFSEEKLQIAIPEQEITVTLESEDGSKTEKVETVPAVP